MQNEYEIIRHNSSNFHIFLVNLLYRTPHLHKDYEISLVMEGYPMLVTPEGARALCPGDLYIMNPFTSHELKAETPALFLSLQVSPAFFTPYYPQMEQVVFDDMLLYFEEKPEFCRKIAGLLFEIAFSCYEKRDYGPLKCAALINELFLLFLTRLSHHLLPEKERLTGLTRGLRMRKILRYIEDHYTEKLLLSDIAKVEGLDLYYLSHFFKECFGITFQDYVTRLRCEKARQLLLLTDYSLLDVSIGSGFSDPKYFNRAFLRQYGCTPKAYRKNFESAKLDEQQQSMLTAQEFLSEEASLVILNKRSYIFLETE